MATQIPRVPHLVGTNKIVRLEDIYDNIGDICGISKLTDAPPEGAETASIRSLVSNGTIRRATVKLANGKIRTVYMTAANCPKVGALETLEYQTGLTIKTAYFSERVTLG
ncbi:hypothetical protein [Nostoc sp. 'Peltigera membranacea cyanobiont' 232]|uniref:hypothetical protein n=1 Tax=Nostoc sp. 'Peltigera membranacea cyanobiont' 232 TaxID=2014531 RepID=UPI000B958D0F|nr:hypothetical protein [Nostoc sp. 'Peltigera membranacea cyanobiont' 232]OYE04744.1 hypothetical protein CDG79_11440 [Nostoc sp. 'Peltigera membranacea cyanobiont' 232]